MRLYATLLNVGFKYSVDGVQFETKDGMDIFLDFDEQDYFKPSEYRSCFRLKSASVSIDGEESLMSDNDLELYNMLKDSKLTELVLYCEDEDYDKLRKVKVKSLKIETPNGELFFKTNKCRVL